MKIRPHWNTAVGRLLFATFILAYALGRATVQTVSPVWIGTDTSIQGNGGSGAKFTAFSQRMVQPITYAGTVSALSSSTLTDTNASWSNGQFGTNGLLSYVEFDNGWMADIADSSANNHSLVLAGPLTWVVSAGDAYRIRPHSTIATLLGTNNAAGLQTGLNPAQADNVLILIPETQQTVTIFYFSNTTVHGWFRADFSAAGNQIIYPEQGLLIRRIGPGNLHLYLSGPIKSGSAAVPIVQGLNLISTLQSITNLPLSALNLYTGNPLTGISSGLNPTAGDNLLLLQPDGSSATYFYYKDSKGNEGWMDALFNSAAAVPINAGNAFYIRRRPPNGSFNWLVPQQ
ncbi:MAG TPA: hypothetical protein VL361_25805 [Candidatus Limnocylindrales bacterium]|jgi:hypothetical protein|nr:hypothetical protein [Candidatus Limnocylindrales bacterium]